MAINNGDVDVGQVGVTILHSMDKVTRLELQVNLCEDKIQVLTLEVTLLRDFIKKVLVTGIPAPVTEEPLATNSTSNPECNGGASPSSADTAMDLDLELDTNMTVDSGLDLNTSTIDNNEFETSSSTITTGREQSGQEGTQEVIGDHRHQPAPDDTNHDGSSGTVDTAPVTPERNGKSPNENENGNGTLQGSRTRSQPQSQTPYVQITQAEIVAASSFLSSSSNFLNPNPGTEVAGSSDSSEATTISIECLEEPGENQSARTAGWTGWTRPRLICKDCGATFQYKSGLASHERKHTGEKPFKCQYCEAVFAQPGGKTTHERRHTGEKPYNCQFCEKAFAQSAGRITHERRHTGEKPYQCQFCPRAFPNSGAKTSHERRHTGEKPYKCQFCPSIFSESGQRKSHERIHTGEKPYECQFCGKAFRAQPNLYAHIRTHTKEKPYMCGVCKREFSQTTGLKAHEKSHQGGRTGRNRKRRRASKL